MEWLYSRFDCWEKDVRFPFGPSDVAQILTTALYIENEFKDIATSLNEPQRKNKNREKIQCIAEYLLHVKSVVHSSSPEVLEGEELIWWDTFFQTAEVLEALAIFYQYCKQKDPSNKLISELEKTIPQGFRFLETQQSDGMWGTHVDTMRVLYSIMIVSANVPFLTQEPHLVFKALRWICDEKQRLDDGSFLHTMFLTVFMSEAFLAVYKNWDMSEKIVADIYDECLWSMPARTTPERSKRFAAELKNLELERNMGMITEEKKALEQKNKNIAETLSRLIIAFALSFITLFVFILVGVWSNILIVSVTDTNLLYQLVAAVLTMFGVSFAILDFLRRK